MSNYARKLANPKWQRKRLEVLQRDNFTCSFCGDTETELHVHHKKYTGAPHEAPMENLITMCVHCHSIEENFKRLRSKLVSCYRSGNIFIAKPSKGDVLLITLDKHDRLSQVVPISNPSDFIEKFSKEREVGNG